VIIRPLSWRGALLLIGAEGAVQHQRPGLDEEETECHASWNGQQFVGECGMGLEQPDNAGQERGREDGQTGPSRKRWTQQTLASEAEK
jgi:hypothetical protein